MKSIISSALLLYLITGLSTTAQVIKKKLELPEFNSIYLNSRYTVYVKQTNQQEITVESLSEIIAATEIKVENGILMINIEQKNEPSNKSLWAKIDDIKLNPTMNVYISVRNIRELQVNGSGKIISENSIASNDIILGVNGSGSLDVDLKGELVKAEVTGAGSMALRGYATTMDALISGSGNISAFNCPMENAKVKVSGTGNCELNVTNTIEALVMGSGEIKHKGNTKSANKKVYGSGTVARAY
jgi:hypothetical protein